jgi:hypothetical protein
LVTVSLTEVAGEREPYLGHSQTLVAGVRPEPSGVSPGRSRVAALPAEVGLDNVTVSGEMGIGESGKIDVLVQSEDYFANDGFQAHAGCSVGFAATLSVEQFWTAESVGTANTVSLAESTVLIGVWSWLPFVGVEGKETLTGHWGRLGTGENLDLVFSEAKVRPCQQMLLGCFEESGESHGSYYLEEGLGLGLWRRDGKEKTVGY